MPGILREKGFEEFYEAIQARLLDSGLLLILLFMQ